MITYSKRFWKDNLIARFILLGTTVLQIITTLLINKINGIFSNCNKWLNDIEGTKTFCFNNHEFVSVKVVVQNEYNF